jgi:hypothetical protein
MDLIQDNKAVKSPKGDQGLLETSQIRRILEVEADRGTFQPLAGDLFRQRRLPYLPRTQDRDNPVTGEQRLYVMPGGLSLDQLHARMVP